MSAEPLSKKMEEILWDEMIFTQETAIGLQLQPANLEVTQYEIGEDEPEIERAVVQKLPGRLEAPILMSHPKGFTDLGDRCV